MYSMKEFDFKAHGAFFAFSNEQFNEQKKDGVEYTHLFSGLIAPKNTAKELLEVLTAFYDNEKKTRLETD